MLAASNPEMKLQYSDEVFVKVFVKTIYCVNYDGFVHPMTYWITPKLFLIQSLPDASEIMHLRICLSFFFLNNLFVLRKRIRN